MNNTFFLQIVRAISIFLIIVCFLLIVKYTFSYIIPFIIAIVIAFVMNSIVSFLEVKWKVTRGVATFFVMGSFLFFFVTILYVIIKQLVMETTNLIETLPTYFNTIYIALSNIGQTLIIPSYEKLVGMFPFLPPMTDEQFKQYTFQFIDSLNTSSSTLIKNIAVMTSNIFSSITYIGIVFTFIMISSYFMTKDWDILLEKYQMHVPKNIRLKINTTIDHLRKSIFGFLKAQIIITFISSIIVFIGLFFFQVENKFTITLVIFFIDFLPYVGIGVVFIPWMIFTFYTTNYILTIQLAILYIVIIIIQQLIEPKIVATHIGIHPLVAIIFLFIGLQSLGLIGIIITPIILIVLSAIYHAGIVHYVWYFIKKG